MTSVLERASPVRTFAGMPWKRLGVLVIGLVVLGLICWRAAQDPVGEWGADESALLPAGDSITFGLSYSQDLRGVESIRILDVAAVETKNAADVRFWVIPIPGGGGSIGFPVSDPPPGWSRREVASGAVMSKNAPSYLLISFGRKAAGRAEVSGVLVRYRTPDGFVHVAREQFQLTGR